MASVTPSVTDGTTTILDYLVGQLRARDTELDGQERPVAILWTDPDGEWRGLIELLLTRLDELLILGDYEPKVRRGPAVWIRCMVDGALNEPPIPAGRVPIVYLPEVARQQLRAGEDCPDLLKPLVELLHRGALWHQSNGNDWTVMAFLTSAKSLGLDIARNRVTRDAMLRALPELALAPVGQFAGQHLQADDFDRLLSGDVVRDLLRWMGGGDECRARMGDNGWEAFCNRCREDLSFDPGSEADVVAGERLGRGEGPWGKVWERFAEAPSAYPGVIDLLRRSQPSELFLDNSRWPRLNEQDEAKLKQVLVTLKKKPREQAGQIVMDLEAEHGERRAWVWARLDRSPLARVLEPLARLAEATRTALGGNTPDDLAQAYLQRGWQADVAVWEALASIPTVDEALIAEVVRHLLEPWLDESARAFQAALGRVPLIGHEDDATGVTAGEDQCLLFADGLRFDLGIRLAQGLEARGCRVKLNHRWAALPTVTATAKPVVTPVADQISGRSLGEGFEPVFQRSGKTVDARGLRAAMQGAGYQVLATNGREAPMSHPARGWVESGDIDGLGHKLEGRLARRIPEEIDRLAEHIQGLLEAGWQSVRVVTDHGWLLLPGGLPKVDLPKHLTASRWARCAVVQGESAPRMPRMAWYWNATEWFAAAPGICCFNKSPAYAHGGLSIQECLIPDLLVEGSGEQALRVAIDSITWRRLRCFVEATVQGGAVTADLRLTQPGGRSVVVTSKPVDPDGAVSLVLEDDDYEGVPLVLVLIDESGRIVAQQPTESGADS
jgi:hypothetical protein